MKLESKLLLESSKWVSLGRLTSESRHEINNNLSVISALNQKLSLMVKNEKVDPGTLCEITDKVNLKVNAIADILKDSREYSRTPSDFSHSSFRFREFVEIEKKLYARLLTKLGISLVAAEADMDKELHGPFSGIVEIASSIIHFFSSLLKTQLEGDAPTIRLALEGSKIRISIPKTVPELTTSILDFESSNIDLPNGARLGPALAKSIADTLGLELNLETSQTEDSFVITL